MSRLRRPGAELWAEVAASVTPLPGRPATAPPDPPTPKPPAARPRRPPPSGAAPKTARAGPQLIEPRRLRRIARGAEALQGRLDLHGLGQDRAHAALAEFLVRAQARGAKTVLVITGKGAGGEGVLRRRVPEWLAAPPLRDLISGLSRAGRNDGGDGALYVALRRR